VLIKVTGVGAVAFQGLAWVVALLMYSLYTQRLMTGELPSPPTRPGMYVSVGPAGYTAAGLISLAKQAANVVPATQFTELSLPDGDLIKNLGILAGLFIILFAFWFFCISTVAVLAGVRRMSFTLNWWAFIFPNAGLTLATIQIAGALNSDPIRGVCSAMTILLVIMWLLVAVLCTKAVVMGEMLWPGKDEDKTMKGIGWGRNGAFSGDHVDEQKERED
jgi:tellurite resistance protein TehA-like permease